MNSRFYGHACVKVSSDHGDTVLMDPWFSQHGAFFSSWFQFPENTSLLYDAFEGVNDICVSHNHGDHFDPPVLRAALAENPSLKLHIAHFPTHWFKKLAFRSLPGLQHRIIEHSAYEPFRIGEDLTVFFVPEESPGEVDSAIVCKSGNTSVVNLNDARLSAKQSLHIREIVTSIDYLCLQGSGASEYPICYTYSNDEMRSRSIKKRLDKLDHCRQIIDLFQPARVLFFAGPPAFLDKDLDRFNQRSETSVFPDQLDIVREIERDRADIAERTLFLLPGDEFLDAYLWTTTNLQSQRLLPYMDKAQYIAAYRERRRDVCIFDWGECPDDTLLFEYFRNMARISPYISKCIRGDITFVVKGARSERALTVDFCNGNVRKGTSANPLYVLTVPASSLMAVLNDKATWDDIFLSCRMKYDERTEEFVPHYKPLLRYMDSELLNELEHYETNLKEVEGDVQMMEVSVGGAIYYIQRFCPHAGTDFALNGRVNEDGTITCLAHRLCFDLRTGRCVNARGYSIKVGRRSRRQTAIVRGPDDGA